ncbi:MAG: pentapeptide repeat-containing protein, partial [Neisseriaceae bacterium]|nr:pentapeptide repeat-containing protein [Neisseriaceae bacterium]
MSSPEYLEKVYPGYPKGFDLRYFQIAAPDQWLSSAAWPSGSNFLLRGFSETEDTIKGNFPKVSARAFGAVNNKIVDNIPLLLQTIWLVPDFNVALLIFTGEVLLRELTQEPYDVLLLALDNDNCPRDKNYYSDILRKRLSKDSKLDSLLDLDLMPNNYKINVIHSMENHPSSIRYTPGPMDEKEVDQYFAEIGEAISFSKMSESNQDIKNLNKIQKNEIVCDDVFSLSDEYQFKDKNYGEFYSYSTTISEKEFSDCQFKDIDFSRYEFINCIFQKCSFYNCVFDGNVFSKSALEDSEFTDCTMKNLKILESELNSLAFSSMKFEKVVLKNSKFSESKIENCYFNDVAFSFVQVNGINWLKSKIDILSFTDSLIMACTFKNTHLISVGFNKSKLEKNSIVYSFFKNCVFDKSFISSFVLGLESKLEKCTFRDCWLEKMGMGNATVRDNLFEYCNIKEINGS